ncbi:hypothetical protein F5Y18DRAFT_427721 [Xylariaceae sp. FL1019]|nr:hypothetical protein F5Y18DRAFT_427721 [Xylariaceae sp. FL1019]
MASNQPDPELYASPTFRFRVGVEAEEFKIHSLALTRLSDYFDALMNNGMQESTQGIANWEDVDREAFLRFCQFAYTNDYEEPLPVAREPDASNSNETGNQIKLVEMEGVNAEKQIRSIRSYLSDMHRGSANNHLSTISPHDETIDISPILRCHVALYILADRCLVEPLRKLALRKLHADLSSWTYGSESIREMAYIVIYAYSWTLDNDRIRAILATFVAAHKTWYIDRPEDEEDQAIIREFQADVKRVVDMFAEPEPKRMGEMFRLRP